MWNRLKRILEAPLSLCWPGDGEWEWWQIVVGWVMLAVAVVLAWFAAGD